MKNIFLILLIFFNVVSIAQTERSMIRQGNKSYNISNYGNAEVAYKKAQSEKAESFEANFNLGDALYKQKKYDDAATQFTVMANTTKDKDKLAKVFHNLGNSYLQANKLDKCIESYKRSLQYNPSDVQTQYNLAYAQHLQQQNQQNKQNKQDKNDKDKDKKDKQDQQKQDQNKQDQQKQQKQNKNQITKEDAQRILEALQNDEKKVQEKLNQQKMKVKKVYTDKDW